MKPLQKLFRKMCLAFWMLIACSILVPVKVSSAAEIDPSTESEVRALLKEVELDGPNDPAGKLYTMGPEIDHLLLQKLAEIDVTQGQKVDRVLFTLTGILISRGYERKILNILKKRLQDEDLRKRIPAAVAVMISYHYYSVRDMANIVAGKESAASLNDRLFFETDISKEEFIKQVLEVLQGNSEIAKDFVLAYLKVIGEECPSCGVNPKKWRIVLDNDKKFLLRGDWFREMHEESDGKLTAIRGMTASPDGEIIALAPQFKSGEKTDSDLWILDTRNKKLKEFQIPGYCYYPSWSPVEDMIAFTNITASGFHICTISKNTSTYTVWTHSPFSIDQWPMWFPESSKVGFTRQFKIRPRTIELWTIDTTTKVVKRAVKSHFCSSVSRIYRVWFPARNNELFLWDCYDNDAATKGLYRVPLNGFGEMEIVAPYDFEYGCSIYPSPDEGKIAFSKDYCSISVYDIGSNETREYDTGIVGDLMWSPDGKYIIYHKSKAMKIGLLSLESGESTVLCDGSPFDAFGPGGDSIYYTKDEIGEGPSIWRINLDGSNNVKIFPVEGIEYSSIQAEPVLR